MPIERDWLPSIIRCRCTVMAVNPWDSALCPQTWWMVHIQGLCPFIALNKTSIVATEKCIHWKNKCVFCVLLSCSWECEGPSSPEAASKSGHGNVSGLRVIAPGHPPSSYSFSSFLVSRFDIHKQEMERYLKFHHLKEFRKLSGFAFVVHHSDPESSCNCGLLGKKCVQLFDAPHPLAENSLAQTISFPSCIKRRDKNHFRGGEKDRATKRTGLKKTCSALGALQCVPSSTGQGICGIYTIGLVFCVWIFSRSFFFFFLSLFDSFGYWYGWVFSNSSVQNKKRKTKCSDKS